MKIIDLTHAMTNGMPVMAGITPPKFRDLADAATDGYAMSQYTFNNHTGTHVDAPAHLIAGGASLDDIPLDRLVTDAVRSIVTASVTSRSSGMSSRLAPPAIWCAGASTCVPVWLMNVYCDIA